MDWRNISNPNANASLLSYDSDPGELQPPKAVDLKRESVLLMASHGSVYAAEIGEAVTIPMLQETRPTYVEHESELSRLKSDATVGRPVGTELDREEVDGKKVDRENVDTEAAEREPEVTERPDGQTKSEQSEPTAVLAEAPTSNQDFPHDSASTQTPRQSVSKVHGDAHSLADSESTSVAGSAFSEGQMPLGRLNTIIRTPAAAAPTVSVSTGVESTIPPRLKRRPVSEMLTRPDRTAPRHRLSLNISHDLDKLMASATHLLSPEMVGEVFERTATSSQSPTGHSAQLSSELAQSRLVHALERGPSCLSSTDSFLTAESTGSLGPSVPGHFVPGPIVPSGLSSAAPISLPKRPSPDSMQRARQASQKWADSDISEHESQATFHRASTVVTPANRTTTPDSEVPLAQVQSTDTPEAYDSYYRGSNPVDVDAVGNGSGAVSENATGEIGVDRLRGELHDDGFYDVGEPVVITGPARVKSVKDSIRPQRHRSKARRSKGAAKLRPFSYNTLINLLESINGTVVGEEFELLNLPVKEKQLIEKIIDLLSRLTLDMVIDESRYDVGIGRLEKAHRALEGFL